MRLPNKDELKSDIKVLFEILILIVYFCCISCLLWVITIFIKIFQEFFSFINLINH